MEEARMKVNHVSTSNYLHRLAALVFGIVVVTIAPISQASQPDPYLRPAVVPASSDNQFTQARMELGKALFFDPRLSGSKWISCATCHNPALGWSDGLPTAIGKDMKVLGRATPTILNTAYQTRQFWDGRARTLEEQALGPIVAESEMNANLDEVLERLAAIPGYVTLFEKAYSGEGITKSTLAKALANFERTVVSTESPFDRWRKGDRNAVSESAKNGFKIFTDEESGRCVLCHQGFNFTDNGFHNIGLKGNVDPGRFAQVPVKILKGAFKTPTLRDVATTAPYMHNGAFKTLEEVVEHYDRAGLDKTETLDPNMQPLKLSSQEKVDLVEFMKTLTGRPIRISLPSLPQ